MKLKDLKDVIPYNQKVGITNRTKQEIPLIDSWKNWKNGGLKTLDVKVFEITTCGYLLLVLDV